MSKVLVTGGAGFIGSHLCERLLAMEQELVVVDNINSFLYPSSRKLRNLEELRRQAYKGRLTIHQIDICDEAALSAVFSKEGIERVVHLAALPGVRNSLASPLPYVQTNVVGTVNLLQLAVRHNIQGFVFGSSSSVYGGRFTIPFREDEDITSPISPYAATKVAGEVLCKTFHHLYGVPITSLRFFTVYGPRGRPDMAPYKFTKNIATNQEISIYGDGSSKRDYTYVADIVDGVVAALEKFHGYQVFNLGGENPIELLQFIAIIEEKLSMTARLNLLPEQPGDVPITCADISRARQHLGYEPKVPVQEGMSRFIEWYLFQSANGLLT